MFFALGKVLELVLSVYLLIVIIRTVFSWVNPDPRNQFVRFVNTVTDPLMTKIRNTIPVVWGGFDFSPIIIILAIYFLLNLIHSTWM